MKYFIKTFGCQQNVADSERIASYYKARDYEPAQNEDEADLVVINSCMIRDKAEERVYGYIRNVKKKYGNTVRIVLTGCIVGAATREPSGKLKKKLQKRIPDVELMSIDEVGFEYEPIRTSEVSTNSRINLSGEALAKKKHGWVVISNGCNNYCAFCIVPFSRGKEVSRPYQDIIDEVRKMVQEGYTSITLLGQNVNSYGADIIVNRGTRNAEHKKEERYTLPNGREVLPVMVEHLGRNRIPTLFPYLLDEIAHIPGLETITFTSSNPWDFSDELIEVIARNKNIDRLLHLPVQSGSDKILKSMNRWYTAKEYEELIGRIRGKVSKVEFITDIIVGFPGETEEDFEETISLAKNAGFVRAFIACYSPRPGTQATDRMEDTIPWEEKKRRYRILNELINKPHLGISESKDWIRTSN